MIERLLDPDFILLMEFYFLIILQYRLNDKVKTLQNKLTALKTTNNL